MASSYEGSAAAQSVLFPGILNARGSLASNLNSLIFCNWIGFIALSDGTDGGTLSKYTSELSFSQLCNNDCICCRKLDISVAKA